MRTAPCGAVASVLSSDLDVASKNHREQRHSFLHLREVGATCISILRQGGEITDGADRPHRDALAAYWLPTDTASQIVKDARRAVKAGAEPKLALLQAARAQGVLALSHLRALKLTRARWTKSTITSSACAQRRADGTGRAAPQLPRA
jgi:hypothetical protein